VEFVNARPSKRKIPGGGLLVPVLQCGDVVVTESEVRPLRPLDCNATSFFTPAEFPSSYRTCYPNRAARASLHFRGGRAWSPVGWPPECACPSSSRSSFHVSLVSPSALALCELRLKSLHNCKVAVGRP